MVTVLAFLAFNVSPFAFKPLRPLRNVFPRACLSRPPPPQINTFFPAPKVNGSIKGGVVLLRMKRPDGGAAPLELSVSYEDREGQKFRWGREKGLATRLAVCLSHLVTC